MTQTHAVIGTGVTGRSVVRHLLANGMECVGFDTRPVQPSAVELEPIDVHWQIEHWSTQKIEQHLAGVNRVVVSPGVPLNLRILQVAEELGLPIVSDIDLFFEATTAPVLGVTGTNGKSTVVSLVGHLLNGVGESCGVGGNIGHAALDLLTRPQSRYVLELSSFQLERSALLPFAASAVLNVSDDHIDHHGSLQNYQQAKLRIYGNAGCRVFNRQDTATKPDESGQWVSFGLDAPNEENAWGLTQHLNASWIVCGDQPVVAVSELPLIGNHNVLNVMAALALASSVSEAHKLTASLASFQSLEHRFQRIGLVDKVVYINDSKATNVGATLAALRGLGAGTRVVLIGGGDAKGADLSVLEGPLSDYATGVVALGKDAEALLAVAQAAGVQQCRVSNMREAVAAAHQMAKDADMVLLSPACSSLDMYQNFGERGREFAEAVRALDAKTMYQGCAS